MKDKWCSMIDKVLKLLKATCGRLQTPKNYNMWMLSSLKVPESRGITYFLRFDQHPTTVRSSKVAIFGL